MNRTKYTEQEFRNAIKNSFSIAQSLIKLNLKPEGGNYRVIKKYIKLYNIDTNHFTGQAHNKGKTFPPKRNIEEYLNNKQTIGSCALKRRLLKEKLFDYKCNQCNLQKWLNKPIPLELHHIDGNSSNNNINNLMLLCPNCHTFTDNYRGNKLKIKYGCPNCNNNKSKTSLLCKKCSNKSIIKTTIKRIYERPTKRPSFDILSKLIWEQPTMKIAKSYGVSDNAVAKWCKIYNLKKPPRGYWTKLKWSCRESNSDAHL